MCLRVCVLTCFLYVPACLLACLPALVCLPARSTACLLACLLGYTPRLVRFNWPPSVAPAHLRLCLHAIVPCYLVSPGNGVLLVRTPIPGWFKWSVSSNRSTCVPFSVYVRPPVHDVHPAHVLLAGHPYPRKGHVVVRAVVHATTRVHPAQGVSPCSAFILSQIPDLLRPLSSVCSYP